MNANARRQIKDIQFRAEHLINGSPTMDDIEEFDQYNEELKKYLISNLLDSGLIERVKQIPRVLEESDNQVVTRGILSAFFAMFASGLVTYFQERHRIENSKDSIREARGAYATIEFFIRNSD
ncbi:hypothetical protein [Ohtaekwangia koreensis]|uniref:Uncharacterized protein n=1 Tax=Ohtaekwangia koreensis TaxID=688867 RepID=A0A1T5IU36_9BACT|nr:hypothetical protein [Ohtaekwangia koreensis]SKC42679.1 hypothetical protein SAMN05660236_0408 [Ohtaekwangia koreensis]